MTTTLIYGQEERLLPWAQERIGTGPFRRDAYSMGLEKNGELVMVAVFDNFSALDCNVHLASDGSRRWMNKELLLSVFAYVFVQLKLNRITGMVPAKRTDVIEFDEHFGFVREGLIRKAMRDDDIVILGMLREECRFITEEQRNAA